MPPNIQLIETGHAAGNWKLFLHTTGRQRTFMFLVLLQAAYVVAERTFFVFNTPMPDESTKHQVIWYYGMIILSMGFVCYFAIHSVLHANVRALVACCVIALGDDDSCPPGL